MVQSARARPHPAPPAPVSANSRLDRLDFQSHVCVSVEFETKFLRLFKPVALGDRIDGWRACWIGDWDKCRVLFVVMVEGSRCARKMRSAQETSKR
jgi:hypothetical protein